MALFFVLISIIQSFAISLGVGSSTIAIVNFFTAIADGTIDQSERKIMGVAYVLLRISMVSILITTILLFAKSYLDFGGLLTTIQLGQLFIIVVLFINAMLMTAHLIPSNFGPAIQAGNWYALGILSTLLALGITNFSLTFFFLVYCTWLVLAISIVNGVMAIQHAKRHNVLKT